MMRFLTVSFLVLLSSSISKSAEPTIDWDTGSPVATPGARFSASGKYTLPPGAGNPFVTYTITRLKVDYRTGTGVWSSGTAILDETTKTWSFTPMMPLAAGTYEVSPRYELKKITYATGTTPGSTVDVFYNPNPDKKNVIITVP